MTTSTHTSKVRPKVEYATIIWSPNERKHSRNLESVQRAATKMILELQDQSYEKRLARLQLPTLEKRGKRRFDRTVQIGGWNGTVRQRRPTCIQ